MRRNFQVVVRSCGNFGTLFGRDIVCIAQYQLFIFFKQSAILNSRPLWLTASTSVVKGNAVKRHNAGKFFLIVCRRCQRGEEAHQHGQAQKERGKPCS